MASYPTTQGVVSEFAVHAQRFSVWIPGYPGIQPFAIGVVYGQPRVIISNALIGDASIDNAKIGDAQINGAKIAYAAINTAHIGEAQIDTLRIGQNAVTTGVFAQGGTNLQVSYYSSGGSCTIHFSSPSSVVSLWIDGAQRAQYDSGGVAGYYASYIAGFYVVTLAAGWHTIRTSGNQLAIFEAKR